MKAKAWSFSALDSFNTCERKFCEESVRKTVINAENPASKYGKWAHKMFEERLGPQRISLVPELQQHEPLMAEIEGHGGKIITEREVALSKSFKPCHKFDPDVWWRGVLDVSQIFGTSGLARHIDYKTGKPHNKVLQLQLGAIYIMVEDPTVNEVDCMFYWTKTLSRTRFTMKRTNIPMVLKGIVPDLARWKSAFNNDQWEPKPSGLCKEYCDVVGCEFHKRGRPRH